MNRVKEFIEKNKKLNIGALICLAIAILYIVSYNMPEWVPGLGKWFEFINTLGVSYLASFIFYIIQVYIPDIKNKERIKKQMADCFLSIKQEVDNANLVFDTATVCTELSRDLRSLDKDENKDEEKINTCLQECYNKFKKIGNTFDLLTIPRDVNEDIKIYETNKKNAYDTLKRMFERIDIYMEMVYNMCIQYDYNLDIVPNNACSMISSYKIMKSITINYCNSDDINEEEYYKRMIASANEVIKCYGMDRIKAELNMK